MTSGGARAKSGPPPQRNSARSDQRGLTFVKLPAEGYKGEVPDFPMLPPMILSPDGAADVAASEELEEIELRLWQHAWSLPQACVWAEEEWRQYTVAQWVRAAAISETPFAKAADRTAMLRLQEEIGLTGPGLVRNGWEIESGFKPQAATPATSRRSSSRDRMAFKVIDGDG